MGDDAVGHALFADRLGQRPGVQAAQADDAAALEPAVEVGIGPPVGRIGGNVAEDGAAGGRLAGAGDLFDVVGIGPDIADVGKGEGHDLGHVGGVGEDLLVAAHGGVEADLAHRIALGADADPLQDRAIGQGQDSGDAGQQVSRHRTFLPCGQTAA